MAWQAKNTTMKDTKQNASCHGKHVSSTLADTLCLHFEPSGRGLFLPFKFLLVAGMAKMTLRWLCGPPQIKKTRAAASCGSGSIFQDLLWTAYPINCVRRPISYMMLAVVSILLQLQKSLMDLRVWLAAPELCEPQLCLY